MAPYPRLEILDYINTGQGADPQHWCICCSALLTSDVTWPIASSACCLEFPNRMSCDLNCELKISPLSLGLFCSAYSNTRKGTKTGLPCSSPEATAAKEGGAQGFL